MGSVVLLGLLDEIGATEGALVEQLLHSDVLRREAELLGVHELHVRLAAGLDHAVGVGQRRRQRLLADHVLPGLRGRDREIGVQVVGASEHDQVDVARQEALEILEGVPNAVPLRKVLRVGARRRQDREELRPGNALERFGVDGRDELRPHEADPDRFAVLHGPSMP
jgi:hypothetical protein